VVQPREASEREPAELRKSESEVGNAESQTPDLGDRDGEVGSRPNLSNQESKPTRRDTERTKVERLVEAKLKAGCTSLREILNSVVATPPGESGIVGRHPPRSP
jgi:hypothetical protein